MKDITLNKNCIQFVGDSYVLCDYDHLINQVVVLSNEYCAKKHDYLEARCGI